MKRSARLSAPDAFETFKSDVLLDAEVTNVFSGESEMEQWGENCIHSVGIYVYRLHLDVFRHMKRQGRGAARAWTQHPPGRTGAWGADSSAAGTAD